MNYHQAGTPAISSLSVKACAVRSMVTGRSKSGIIARKNAMRGENV